MTAASTFSCSEHETRQRTYRARRRLSSSSTSSTVVLVVTRDESCEARKGLLVIGIADAVPYLYMFDCMAENAKFPLVESLLVSAARVLYLL